MIAAAAVLGQQPDVESPMYKHLEPLGYFVGEWQAKSQIPANVPPSNELGDIAGKTVVLTTSVEWAPGKCAQIVHVDYHMQNVVRIRGTAIRSWDQKPDGSGEICERFFTTHKGTWKGTWKKVDEQTWEHKYTGVDLDGKKCKGTRVYKLENKNKYILREKDRFEDGEPIPDIQWEFERQKKAPTPSDEASIKELEFLIGEWKAESEGGGKTLWTFEWNPNKNVIENVVTGVDANGDIKFENRGMMGWDPRSRRIVNRCFARDGEATDFFWEKQTDGVWKSWHGGGKGSGTVTVIDGNTWRITGAKTTLVFKKVEDGQ